MKKIIAALIGIGIICGLLFGAAVVFYHYMNRPTDLIMKGDYHFTIERGETVQQVAERLEDESYVRSARFMSLAARLQKNQNRIKHGAYKIPEASSTTEILDLFVSGRQMLVKVTVPEGYTVSKISRLLEEREIVDAEAFLETAADPELAQEYGLPQDNFEGFLFPDTYFFPKMYTPEKVIETMVDNFFTVLEEIAPAYKKMSGEELMEKIIVASIVEREFRVSDEAPLIASVFYNRIAENQRLQSCATVEYVITEIQGKEHPEYLTYDDLDIVSPFNTYRVSGLPPGPICNPGAVAMNAAFNPAETDYYYFVLKDPDTGEHKFSKTDEEHNRAKRLYLKN